MKVISNKIIRKLNPCYDPSEVVKDENEELPVKEWVHKYRYLVKYKSDIIWLLCNKLYMSEKDMRLFAVWCAREALKLVESPDPRSVEACNVAERFANREATIEELTAAKDAANDAAWEAAWADAAWEAAYAAARAAANDASYAAKAAALDAQINKLLTYF